MYEYEMVQRPKYYLYQGRADFEGQLLLLMDIPKIASSGKF